MTNPQNTKPFDLEIAKKGHPLIRRDDGNVKFIAHVPEAHEIQRIIVMKGNGSIYTCSDNGRVFPYNESDGDLFLDPLGYCEGKPVFAGDILTGIEDNKVYYRQEFIASIGTVCFDKFKWPSNDPVIETKMKYSELYDAYNPRPGVWDSEGCLNLANAAIARAIKDGDVIPDMIVHELAGKAFERRSYNGNKSFNDHMEDILNEYIKELRK